MHSRAEDVADVGNVAEKKVPAADVMDIGRRERGGSPENDGISQLDLE